MGEEEGILGALFGCCCGASGLGEELYKDWESHPACRQYAILKRLGEGGFSEVHLAQDKLTGKTVALKVVFLNKGGLTKEQKKILTGEARLVRMVAHPNVVRCMQVLETRRQQVLVLEHLSGGEMLRQLQRMKRYSEANACQMFKQIVDAVAYLHSLGILHRDIKPENCLLAKPAGHYATKSKPVKVKLIDLGMAGLYRPNKPMHGCMGSPGFIAPEVILGEPHSPAMDVYSLGVLLFIMLVGRKPWDAQRSHTLAYAVQPTCEAPGLRDPVFTGLSAPAQKLLCWMLAEDPSRRPSTQQVLGHKWVLQGGVCKAETGDGFAAAATAAAPSRVYQQVVQQRLQVLAHSRDVMGTARCMMVLHGRGNRSQAVMFHKAVKAARLQLQQQAAALQAAGQMPAGTADFVQAAAAAAAQPSPPFASQLLQQQQQPVPVAPGMGAAAVPAGVQPPSSAPQQGPAGPAGDTGAPAAAGFDSSHQRMSDLARSSAPVLSAAQHGSRGVLPKSASSTSLAAAAAAAAAAAGGAAPGQPAASRASKAVTVGQLAREGLNKRHSVLLGAMPQQPLQLQQQQKGPQQQQQQDRGGKEVIAPDSAAAGTKGHHRRFASEGGAQRAVAAGATVGAGSSAAAAAAAAAAAVAVAGTQPVAIHLQQLALFDGLERGMSAPNTEAMPFSPPIAGSRAVVGRLRADRAVSTSPGALALLDAEDQMCLLHAAGTSLDDNDGDATLLGGNVLSWGRRGAADMLASFRENYNMRPIARSIAQFSQSLTRSFGRSVGSPLAAKSPAPRCYMDAAAAAAATDTHTDAASRECSVTQAAASTLSFTQQGAVSPSAAAAPPAGEVLTHDEISFMVTAGGPAAQPATEQQQQQQQQQDTLRGVSSPSPAAAAAASAPATAPRHVSPVAVMQLPGRTSDDSSVGHHGSVEHNTAFLGAQMSLDSNLAYSILGAAFDTHSLSSSLAGPLFLTTAAEGAAPMPCGTQLAVSNSLGSCVAASVFVSAAGAAAAAAAAAAEPAGGRISPAMFPPAIVTQRCPTAAAAAAAARRGALVASPANGPFGVVREHAAGVRPAAGSAGALVSPGVRAAATAAAARAEEEGIGLPNGLWLQQSQSIKNSTVASILQLLSGTKSPSAGGAAASGDVAGLGSAGGSLELAGAESRTLSGSLLPALQEAGSGSADLTGAAELLVEDAATGAGSAAAAAGDGAGAAQGGMTLSPRERSGEAAESTATDRGASRHSRHISMVNWLEQEDSSSQAAPQPAAAVPDGSDETAAVATAGEEWGSGARTAYPISPAKDIAAAGAHSNVAAEAVRQAGACSSVVAGSQSSRAVSVPQSVAAGARRRGSHAGHLWLSPARGGRHRSSGRDSTAAEGQDAAAAAAAAVAAGGGGSSAALERLPSVADSSVEFYVGSFWSPVSLAGRADARQQQLAEASGGHLGPRHLARSTSSMGRLDSLQDSLPCGSLSTAAELDFAGDVGSPQERDGLVSPLSSEQPVRRGRRSGGAVFSSGGGAALEQRDRASLDGGEGLLEGCLPADCSGETWGGQAGASVLARVHSGTVGVGRGALVPGKGSVAAAAAGDRQSVRVLGANLTVAVGTKRLGGSPAAVSPSTAAEAEMRPYKWIAKAVASRSPQQQQPQFDAFDEPHGAWYHAGT